MPLDTRIQTRLVALRSAAATIPPPNALLMLLEGRAPLEFSALLAAMPWLRALPRGDGHPVLVFPGMGANDVTTVPLRRFLQSLGYPTQAWGQGFNFGPRPGVLERCADDIRALAERHGQPVSLIGWSLGGLYAREMAKELPKLARCVDHARHAVHRPSKATNAWRVYELLSGRRSRRAADRAHRTPPPVPTTSIYSRTDGIVAWRCSLNEPGPARREHRGACEPRRHGHESARAVCGRRSPGAAAAQWQPFERAARAAGSSDRQPSRGDGG